MPSNAAILEHAFNLANQEMFTISLQCRRLRSTEPEDETFVFRWWADLQFLIVALRRLYRAAELAGQVPSAKKTISAALENFDDALPCLRTMRNVGEHIEDYALSRGRNKDVKRGSLQVGGWDGTTYTWLGKSLNIDEAHDAAEKLFSVVRNVLKSQSPPLKQSTVL